MSPSVIELFVADARRFTSRLREAIRASGEQEPDVDGLRRAARRLHHGALLSDQEAIIEAAAAIQRVALEIIARKREWSRDLKEKVGAVISGVDAVVDTLPDRDPEAEARLVGAVERMLGTTGAEPREEEWPPRPREPALTAAAADTDRELEALVSELRDAVERLENDPRDREPLKSILRRIRGLRDRGEIQVLSPPDKALTAVEELILQIADLNATVGPGYLTVFRHARDVLEEMRAVRAGAATATGVGDHAVEVDRLKEHVIETARRARQVIWVSELFYEEGPHVLACPLAEREAGSAQRYFLREARRRLERSEELRGSMLSEDAERMRLAGESLSQTLRHLRERAVAFGHAEMGRITRRAAAALRAQLVRPPARLRAIALGFGDLIAALGRYVESEDPDERRRAIEEADRALESSIEDEALEPDEGELDPDRALEQALSLRTRLDERLQRLGPDAKGLKEDLEQLFELVAQYVASGPAPPG